MILVEGEKYACEQCIRGHRSSTCRHMKRPLVLVRSRGRPLTDSTQRIAIFAENVDSLENIFIKKEDNATTDEIRKEVNKPSACCSSKSKASLAKSSSLSLSSSAESIKLEQIDGPNSIKQENDSSACGKSESGCCPTPNSSAYQGLSSLNAEGCSNKKDSKSVIVLKASKRQVFNVCKRSLKLLEPVIDIPNNQVGIDMMHKISKKRQHGNRHCKTKTGIPRQSRITKGTAANRSSSCCGEVKKPELQRNLQSANVTNSQIPLNSMIQMNYSVRYPNMSNSYPQQQQQQQQQQQLHRSLSQHNQGSSDAQSQTMLYDMYIADSCTVPGSCACDPDKCKCEGCVTHNNSSLGLQTQIDSNSLGVQYANTYLPNPPQQQVKIPQYQLHPSPYQLSSLPPQQYQDMQRFEQQHQMQFGQAHIQSMVPLFEQNFQRMLAGSQTDYRSPTPTDASSASDSTSSAAECRCPDDECACYDCELHGIVNGVRMSDGVRVNSERTEEDSLQSEQHHQQQVRRQIDQSQFEGYSQSYRIPPQYQERDTHSSIATGVIGGPVNALQVSAHEFLDNLDLSEFQDDCCCPDDNCVCSNCFKHGRFANAAII